MKKIIIFLFFFLLGFISIDFLFAKVEERDVVVTCAVYHRDKGVCTILWKDGFNIGGWGNRSVNVDASRWNEVRINESMPIKFRVGYITGWKYYPIGP